MKRTLVTRPLSWLIAAWVGFVAARDALAQAPADTASLTWAPPTTMPPGAWVAVLSGDPTVKGECTFLIDMSKGYRIGPHFHPGEVQLAIREGTLLIGKGDELDTKRARTLAAGDSMTIAAEMHHFLVANRRTLVTMKFMGPFAITYLRMEDAPQRKSFPYRY